MLMVSQQQRYLAYMLRLWQVGGDKMVWRASLENAHTGARQGFASLNALFVFLEDETSQNLSSVDESCLGAGEGREHESEPHSGG
jgi:hypothetical protein